MKLSFFKEVDFSPNKENVDKSTWSCYGLSYGWLLSVLSLPLECDSHLYGVTLMLPYDFDKALFDDI